MSEEIPIGPNNPSGDYGEHRLRSVHAPLPTYPIQLSKSEEALVKQWAADDRLWTTQETVEFNLRIFARAILKAASE